MGSSLRRFVLNDKGVGWEEKRILWNTSSNHAIAGYPSSLFIGLCSVSVFEPSTIGCIAV